MISLLAHRAVISSASRCAVWSFHRTNIASGSSAYSGRSASGVHVRSTRHGVLAVVSTETALICGAASGRAATTSPITWRRPSR